MLCAPRSSALGIFKAKDAPEKKDTIGTEVADLAAVPEAGLGLDIPFCPQLPRVSFYEDMYIQASQHFPGIVVDPERERVSFNTAMFEDELMSYLQKMEEPEKPVS